jgi:PilZ domain
MSAVSTAAMVQPISNPYFRDLERRIVERHLCAIDATSREHDGDDALSWGAQVDDISENGLSVSICYPFKPGTFLSVEMQCPDGMVRGLTVRVVHVHDRRDGQWRLGCEILKPLSAHDLEKFI